jgi:hypothetical protein
MCDPYLYTPYVWLWCDSYAQSKIIRLRDNTHFDVNRLLILTLFNDAVSDTEFLQSRIKWSVNHNFEGYTIGPVRVQCWNVSGNGEEKPQNTSRYPVIGLRTGYVMSKSRELYCCNSAVDGKWVEAELTSIMQTLVRALHSDCAPHSIPGYATTVFVGACSFCAGLPTSLTAPPLNIILLSTRRSYRRFLS